MRHKREINEEATAYLLPILKIQIQMKINRFPMKRQKTSTAVKTFRVTYSKLIFRVILFSIDKTAKFVYLSRDMMAYVYKYLRIV